MSRFPALVCALAMTTFAVAACTSGSNGLRPADKSAAEACAVRWLRLTLHNQFDLANRMEIQGVGGSHFGVPPYVPVSKMTFSATSARQVGDQWVVRTSLGSPAGAGPIVYLTPLARVPARAGEPRDRPHRPGMPNVRSQPTARDRVPRRLTNRRTYGIPLARSCRTAALPDLPRFGAGVVSVSPSRDHWQDWYCPLPTTAESNQLLLPRHDPRKSIVYSQNMPEPSAAQNPVLAEQHARELREAWGHSSHPGKRTRSGIIARLRRALTRRR